MSTLDMAEYALKAIFEHRQQGQASGYGTADSPAAILPEDNEDQADYK